MIKNYSCFIHFFILEYGTKGKLTFMTFNNINPKLASSSFSSFLIAYQLTDKVALQLGLPLEVVIIINEIDDMVKRGRVS